MPKNKAKGKETKGKRKRSKGKRDQDIQQLPSTGTGERARGVREKNSKEKQHLLRQTVLVFMLGPIFTFVFDMNYLRGVTAILAHW